MWREWNHRYHKDRNWNDSKRNQRTWRGINQENWSVHDNNLFSICLRLKRSTWSDGNKKNVFCNRKLFNDFVKVRNNYLRRISLFITKRWRHKPRWTMSSNHLEPSDNKSTFQLHILSTIKNQRTQFTLSIKSNNRKRNLDRIAEFISLSQKSNNNAITLYEFNFFI